MTIPVIIMKSTKFFLLVLLLFLFCFCSIDGPGIMSPRAYNFYEIDGIKIYMSTEIAIKHIMEIANTITINTDGDIFTGCCNEYLRIKNLNGIVIFIEKKNQSEYLENFNYYKVLYGEPNIFCATFSIWANIDNTLKITNDGTNIIITASKY